MMMQETRVEAISAGMSCSPEWFCQSVSYGFGVLVLLLVVLLARRIYKESQKSKKQRRR